MDFWQQLLVTLLEMVVIGLIIAALYLFLKFLILTVRSRKRLKKSFLYISIITLSTFFLIPSVYYVRSGFIKARKKILIEKKRMQELKLNIDDANNTISILSKRLESERKENDKLRKQLNDIIKTKSLDEGNKRKRDAVIQTNLDKDFFKTKLKVNSEAGKIDLDTKNQDVIFKVQIISSVNSLAINSPKLKGLKNVWEYKDGSLYKYTVGNEKDLKSASVLQSECRSKGFVGAFVVAFKNGKRIPVKEAQKLLK